MHGLIRFFSAAGILLTALSCGGDGLDSGDSVSLLELQAAYDEEEDVGVPDSTYTVDVEVYHPDTGPRALYGVDVEILDNQVAALYLPGGEQLDASSLFDTELDPSGCATFAAEDGRVFGVCVR